MNLRTLRKKAHTGALEVEDILKAAAEHQPGLSEELHRLSGDLGWPATGVLSDGSRVVPLAKWAEVAAAYSSGGVAALAEFASKPEDASFVLALLVELKSPEALSFLLEDYAKVIEAPSHALGLAFRIASALNLMLSFKHSTLVSKEQAAAIQDFLFRLLPFAESDRDRAIVILALRGVGDDRSIRLLSSLDELQPPWHDAKQTSLRVIRKRLRQNAL
jgi:hypothetical protein